MPIDMKGKLDKMIGKASEFKPILKVKKHCGARGSIKESATGHALAITELLEIILGFLPPRRLLRARLVSSSFRNTIDQSPALSRETGISSEPSVDTHYNTNLFREKSVGCGLGHNTSGRVVLQPNLCSLLHLHMDVEPYLFRKQESEIHRTVYVLHYVVTGREDDELLAKALLQPWATHMIASHPVHVKVVLHDRGLAVHVLMHDIEELSHCIARLANMAKHRLIHRFKWLKSISYDFFKDDSGDFELTLALPLGRSTCLRFDIYSRRCAKEIRKRPFNLNLVGQRKLASNSSYNSLHERHWSI